MRDLRAFKMNTRKFLEGLFKFTESVPKVGHVRMTSALVLKNDVVALAFATKKSHPLQARYSKNKESIYLHAEINVIQKALRIISLPELERSVLYVCRIKTINNALEWGNACPCLGCQRAIEAFNISTVIYTLDGKSLSWNTINR